MTRSRLALAVVFFFCLAFAVHQLHQPNLADFQVYDTAAALVHHGESVMIYNGADTGEDPQLALAKSGTPFARQASELGIAKVRLYVYPPVLADLLVPFSLVPEALAGQLWLAINIVALLLTAWLTGQILGIRSFSLASAALCLGIFILFSTGMSLIWGQVTILLLLLWTLGISWYQRDWKALSAVALAIAAAIKLTPLLAILPIVIWRDWKWLRTFCFALLAMTGAVLLINGWSPLHDYVFHVLPAMAGGIPNAENKSLISSVQLFWIAVHHGKLAVVTMCVPHSVLTVAKALAILAILAVILPLARMGPAMRMSGRLRTLALIALLSAIVSPVSWKAAYVVEYLALAFAWAEVFRAYVSSFHLVLLTLFTIELGSYFFDSVEMKLFHGIPQGVLTFTTPLSALALVLWQLSRMPEQAIGNQS